MVGGAAFYEQSDGAASAPLRPGCIRREPEKTLLHQWVRENLETLLAQVRAEDPDGLGLPTYVEQEFRRYLKCGIPSAAGFSLQAGLRADAREGCRVTPPARRATRTTRRRGNGKRPPRGWANRVPA